MGTLAYVRQDNLKTLMKVEGFLTASTFASFAAGIPSSQSIRNYINGSSPMSDSAMRKITAAFEVDFGWFDTDRRDEDVTTIERPRHDESVADKKPPSEVVVIDIVNLRAWSDAGDFDMALKVPKEKIKQFIIDLIDGK